VVLPLVIVGGLAGGYVWLANNQAGTVPARTTVVGVEIGGLAVDDAVARLDQELGQRAVEPVEVTVDGEESALDPQQAGLEFSAKTTLEGVADLTYHPGELWKRMTGSRELPPALTVDEDKLTATIHDLATRTAVAPVDGTMSVEGEIVSTTAPVDGRTLDEPTARALVSERWFDAKTPIDLPVVSDPPGVDQAELDRATREIAEPLLSAPVEIAMEDKSVELPVEVLAKAASITAIKGTLTLSFDEATITDAVQERLPEGIESDARNARFTFKKGKPKIVPGTAGRTVDFAAIPGEIALAAQSPTDRRAEVAVIDIDPTQSEEELAKLGVVEVVGEFATQAYSNWSRTENLKLASKKVTGVLVKPGEIFSLNDTLGPRTVANGWHDAPVVVNGRQQEGMGGGLSQFSTTLYNAGHFAGMEDVEHQPHYDYFSRYPRGREATLWEGVLDNRFKNNTPYGVLLRAWVGNDLRVHVQLWSTHYWDVESVIGDSYGIVPAKTITQKAGPDCKPQDQGSNGFSVTYWRTLSLNGKVEEKQEWSWTYMPTNGYKCEEPRKPKDDEKDKKKDKPSKKP